MENVKEKIYTVTILLSILSNFLNWAVLIWIKVQTNMMIFHI